MHTWWNLWERLAAAPAEEAEALELVLAEMRRGTPLPGALRYAARAMAALASVRTGAGAPARLASLLDGWSQALPSPRSVPPVWRALFAAWDAFRAPEAIGSHGLGLVDLLRIRRSLRLEALKPWTFNGLALAVLCLAVVAAATLHVRVAPAMLAAVDARGGLRSLGAVEALGPVVGLMGAAVLLSVAMAWWVSRRWVRSICSERESELVFFVAVGLGASKPPEQVLVAAADWVDPLPALPFRGTARVARAGGGERAWLLAAARPGDEGLASRATCRRPARREVATLVALARLGPVTPELVSIATAGLADRTARRRMHLIAAVWFLAALPPVFLGVPACLAAVSGPVGGFWSQRVGTALKQVPSLGPVELP